MEIDANFIPKDRCNVRTKGVVVNRWIKVIESRTQLAIIHSGAFAFTSPFIDANGTINVGPNMFVLFCSTHYVKDRTINYYGLWHLLPDGVTLKRIEASEVTKATKEWVLAAKDKASRDSRRVRDSLENTAWRMAVYVDQYYKRNEADHASTS